MQTFILLILLSISAIAEDFKIVDTASKAKPIPIFGFNPLNFKHHVVIKNERHNIELLGKFYNESNDTDSQPELYLALQVEEGKYITVDLGIKALASLIPWHNATEGSCQIVGWQQLGNKLTPATVIATQLAEKSGRYFAEFYLIEGLDKPQHEKLEIEFCQADREVPSNKRPRITNVYSGLKPFLSLELVLY